MLCLSLEQSDGCLHKAQCRAAELPVRCLEALLHASQSATADAAMQGAAWVSPQLCWAPGQDTERQRDSLQGSATFLLAQLQQPKQAGGQCDVAWLGQERSAQRPSKGFLVCL